ncbi:hypothetical protein A2U01_0118534, partial [Trifolium medium]|nr:hypothetical protein [Trifolium medium]
MQKKSNFGWSSGQPLEQANERCTRDI